MTFIQLMATALELGSCWIQVRKREHASGCPARDDIARHLDLPDRLEVEAMIAIGYPAQPKAGHARDTLLFDRVHQNGFGNPFRFKNTA